MDEDTSNWRLATTGGIPLRLKESTYSFGAEDGTGKEVIIIQANQLARFVNECLPSPFIFMGTVFYPRRRYMPGLPALSTQKISAKGLIDGKPVDPFGTDPTAPTIPSDTYERFLEVTIDYGTLQENDTERDPTNPWTFLEISGRAAGEFLSTGMRNENTVWIKRTGADDENNKDRDVPNTVTVSTVEYNCRWTQIPYAWFYAILMPRLRLSLGKVNDSVMNFFFQAPIHTILFLGFSFSQQYTWREGLTGASPISLDLAFLEKNFEGPGYDGNPIQVTHDHLYRPAHGWQRMQINEQDLYEEVNLNAIFEP